MLKLARTTNQLELKLDVIVTPPSTLDNTVINKIIDIFLVDR